MMLKGPLVHLLALLTAILLIVGVLFIVKRIVPDSNQRAQIISGNQQVTRGVYANLTAGDVAELQYIASIKNPNQLTIFGSSEFSGSPYCTYNFLPDTLGFAALGIGHAHHQCFSILCELLAACDNLKNSKICIVLSTSWFHTPGTNTEAFVEFVRPNFLSKIDADKSIDLKYKAHIGKFILDHTDEFTSVTKLMEAFVDNYRLSQSMSPDYVYGRLSSELKQIHVSVYGNPGVVYRVDSAMNLAPKSWAVDRDKYLQKMQADFISSITTNKMFVYDEYYNKYVIDSATGVPREDSISVIDLESNAELEDFRLLVALLSENDANCSFVIQPMNPYHYKHAERNKPLIDTLTTILDRHKMPYLNMYAYDEESFEPGILKDIMHLGDYGWVKINFFLDSIYHER